MPKWYVGQKPTKWLKLRNLIEWLLAPTEALEPKILGVIDFNETLKRLKEVGPEAHIYLSDEKFQITDAHSIYTFLAQDDTNQAKYTAIWYDCDDFSFRLMGQFHRGRWACLAFGIAWSKVHAFNIFLDDKDVWIIEPQNDTVVRFKDADPKAYKPLQLVVM